MIAVSGSTAALPNGEIAGGDNAYAQAVQAFETALAALERAGGRREDVIRTRMFVTDIGRWKEFARAHAEFFGEVKPAATMVEVARLVDPAMLIELELDAVVAEGGSG